MNIVVLAGGWSSERDVSLTSGSLIANALMKRGHRVVLVDTYLGIDVTGDVAEMFHSDGAYHYSVGTSVPDLPALRQQSGNGNGLIGKNVLKLCQCADVVFNAMHGGMGEDGTIQAWLDCHGICYTGTGAPGASLSMDKDIAKKLLRAAGIDVPRGTVVCPKTEPDACGRVLTEIGLPCVVKPCCGGSSVGVSMVDTPEQLQAALHDGAVYEERLVVEQKIVGRELTVGVLGGKALPPVEIIPHDGFYDYHNKYQGGCATELCPAPLTDEQTRKIQELTLQGFEALHLEAYARFDYLMDATGRMWCLEANALPGMTPTSLLPQMAQAVGMDYGSLCEEIVRLAMKRHQKKQQ